MSSICAIWNEGRDSLVEPLLHKMSVAQAVYGPDQQFYWTEGRIGLAGNLTHSLVEDSFDRQPLWSADRSCCLVADVQLYNRPELIGLLDLTATAELADSAILLHAWQRWGTACLDRLIGGFAFAVWTPARQELFAARDHVGERPLHYHQGDGFFALASMPKGILALPGAFQGFDEQRLADALVVAAPERGATFFKGIRAVPIGSFLKVTPGGLECRSYWNPVEVKPTRFRRDEDYPEALLEIFDRAVEGRLRSPKGIASQLSSGLDSSSVTASAARILAARGEGLTSFTSVPRPEFHGRGLPGRLVYEAPGASEVARMYPNINHVLVDTEGGDLLADMKRWTDVMDEPAQNGTNLLWIGMILQQARKRDVGVMLQGVYGNGTISFESGAPLEKFFRHGHWIKLFQTVRSLRAHGDTSWKGGALMATNGLMPAWAKRRMIPSMGDFNLDFSAVNPVFAAEFKLREKTFQRLYGDMPSLRQDRTQLYERFDFGTLNAGIQALSGISPRDPTGDKRVFEFCYSIPVEQYVAGGHSRALVRRAMRGRLPATTLARYKRGQQGVDWYLNMAEALPAIAQDLIASETSAEARRALDLPRLKRLAATWPADGHETNRVTVAWNYALTRGTAMGYFLRSHQAETPA